MALFKMNRQRLGCSVLEHLVPDSVAKGFALELVWMWVVVLM